MVGITTSLKFLEPEFLKSKSNTARAVTNTIRNLYTNLSVLHSQAWVPVSVLSRMWQQDERFVSEIADLFI